jgi:hypothetical protein
MKDPLVAPSSEWHSTSDWSNYCDMAENIKPGIGEGTCYEVDLLEANAAAMRASLALDPRPLGCRVAVCCKLARPLLFQRPTDRDSPPQLRGSRSI